MILKMENGMLVDSISGNPFDGVAPRDLNVGDQYETISFDGSLKLKEVTSKEIKPNGFIFVMSKEV